MVGVKVDRNPSSSGSNVDLISDSDQVRNLLCNKWRPTFAAAPAPLDPTIVNDFLSEYQSDFQFNDVKVPSSFHYKSFISRLSHSAPGPDGIPYAVFQGALKLSISI